MTDIKKNTNPTIIMSDLYLYSKRNGRKKALAKFSEIYGEEELLKMIEKHLIILKEQNDE